MSIHVWFRNADGALGNRLAWRAAAALGATFALIVVLLHQGVIRWEHEELPSLSKSPIAKDLPDRSSGRAARGESVTDVQRRVEFCSRHVTPERSFVVFANGTCVIVNEPADDPVGTAIEILNKCGDTEARFITRQIEADSYMVTYSEPAFHCLFADEIAQLAPVVDASYASFLAPAERLVQPDGWEPPFDAKLGLLARTFLHADTRDREIAKVIRAMPVPGVMPDASQASHTGDL